MNSQRVHNSLNVLLEAHTAREQAISEHPSHRTAESDDAADSGFPLFEFRLVYSKLHEAIVTNWNVGFGRKSPQKPIDVLFMTLTVLKHCGSWYVLAAVFNMRGPTFERLIKVFLKILSPLVRDRSFKHVSASNSYTQLKSDDSLFESFPFAIEALDSRC